MTDMSLDDVPLSFVFHKINYQISCLFRNYTSGLETLDPAAADRTLVGQKAFLDELKYALGKALSSLPGRGIRNDMEINHYATTIHKRIHWTVSGVNSAKRGQDDVEVKDDEAKRSKKDKDKLKRKLKKSKKALAGTVTKPKTGGTSNASSKGFCLFHALKLLKVTKGNGEVIKCGRSECRQTHLTDFTGFTKLDLLASAKDKLHDPILSGFNLAVEVLPTTAFKA